MDVKRIESIAVPTALATVGAGLAGYMMPSITKDGKISDESPVGTALLEKSVGEIVKVETPGGESEFVILEISM